MPSNRKQRDLKATSLIVGGSSASTTSEIMGGGTYVKRDKPGNVQSKKYFQRLYLSIRQWSGQCKTVRAITHFDIFSLITKFCIIHVYYSRIKNFPVFLLKLHSLQNYKNTKLRAKIA
jgi:hypothetical protein